MEREEELKKKHEVVATFHWTAEEEEEKEYDIFEDFLDKTPNPLWRWYRDHRKKQASRYYAQKIEETSDSSDAFIPPFPHPSYWQWHSGKHGVLP